MRQYLASLLSESLIAVASRTLSQPTAGLPGIVHIYDRVLTEKEIQAIILQARNVPIKDLK